MTLPRHNGARNPSLKLQPFKSQTPFRGPPSIHSRSDAFVPDFFHCVLTRMSPPVYVCRSFYRFFIPPHSSTFRVVQFVSSENFATFCESLTISRYKKIRTSISRGFAFFKYLILVFRYYCCPYNFCHIYLEPTPSMVHSIPERNFQRNNYCNFLSII